MVWIFFAISFRFILHGKSAERHKNDRSPHIPQSPVKKQSKIRDKEDATRQDQQNVCDLDKGLLIHPIGQP
jgi:hypothetical protein